MLFCSLLPFSYPAMANNGSTEANKYEEQHTHAAHEKQITYKTKGFLGHLWSDSKYIFTSATRLDKDDILPIGIFTAATAALMLYDEEIRDIVKKTDKDTVERRNFFSNFEPLGNGTYILPASAFLYAGGWMLDNEKLEETGTMTLESVIISGAITFGIKYLLSRNRPSRGNGAYKFEIHEIKLGEHEDSFPSGHTTTAFSFASVIAEQYDNIYVSALSYGAATILGIQRIYDDAHWASDVLAGAVIGTLVGKTIVKQHKIGSSRLTIAPEISSERRYLGLRLGYRF